MSAASCSYQKYLDMSDFIHKFAAFARSIAICIHVLSFMLLALVEAEIRDVTTVPASSFKTISNQFACF